MDKELSLAALGLNGGVLDASPNYNLARFGDLEHNGRCTDF
jgi:hypothetical protein